MRLDPLDVFAGAAGSLVGRILVFFVVSAFGVALGVFASMFDELGDFINLVIPSRWETSGLDFNIEIYHVFLFPVVLLVLDFSAVGDHLWSAPVLLVIAFCLFIMVFGDSDLPIPAAVLACCQALMSALVCDYDSIWQWIMLVALLAAVIGGVFAWHIFAVSQLPYVPEVLEEDLSADTREDHSTTTPSE